MSSYSFSHQFYQHWTLAPETVRAAIVQELTDITTLLQTNTPIEKFTFSLPDLDLHLDSLYSAHETQKAATKEIAAKQAKHREAAEQQRLAEEQRMAQQKAHALAEAERLESKKQEEKTEETEKTNTAANTDSKEVSNKKNTVEHHRSINTIADKKSDVTDAIAHTKIEAMVKLSPTDSVLSNDHEALIHELGVHVDDYLTEQMMQLSEDLKSWLRAEVSRQLAGIAEKNQAVEDIIQKNSAKKN